MAYQHCRGSAGNAWHAMVFSQPETLVTPAFAMLGQAQGIAERLRGITAFSNR
jgi:hypothetical protein